MRKPSIRLSLSFLLAGGVAACAQSPTNGSWQLIWSDEFDGQAIDSAKWEHQVFPGKDSGNHELQFYTARPENSFVSGGIMTIRALREEYKGHAYTSARLTTAKFFSFRYGKAEARINLPSAKGMWPAFWMLPTKNVYGGWPHSGEIDIVESVNDADEVYGTIHFGNPNHVHQGAPYRPAGWAEGQMFSDDFHVYAVEWEPEEIRWYVDGHLFGTQNKWQTRSAPYPAPFDQEFHLILNVAVGGDWPGPPDETSAFPQEMQVDYVRVYQTDNKLPEVTITSPADGATIPANAPAQISVEASDPDGTISRVTLELGMKMLDEVTEPPYALTLPPMEDGCYDDFAVYAYDNTGMRRRATLSLVIGKGCPQEPYTTPIPVPGRWEAENFDKGKEGEAFHDVDEGNNGGKYRPTSAVDLSSAADGTVYVGWTEPGEWVEYHAEIAEEGEYQLSARAAAGMAPSTLELGTDNQEAVVRIDVPQTANWETFTEVSSTATLRLPKGPAVLRLSYPTGGVNIDWLELKKTE